MTEHVIKVDIQAMKVHFCGDRETIKANKPLLVIENIGSDRFLVEAGYQEYPPPKKARSLFEARD